MLDLSNKNFKVTVVIIFQEIRANTLEANGNIENIAVKQKT